MSDRPLASSSGRLARTMALWIALVQRFPIVTLAFCLTIAGLAFFHTISELQFKTSPGALIHPADNTLRVWNSYAEEFGDKSDILVVVRGEDRPATISAVETIAREIGSFPQHFEKLTYRLEGEKQRAKGLYKLKVDDLKAIASKVELLSQSLASPDAPLSLETLAHASAEAIESAASTPSGTLERRPLLLQTAGTLEALEGFLRPGSIYHSPWADATLEGVDREIRKTPSYFSSEDGRIAFLCVVPKESAGEFIRYRAPVRILRDILARVRPLYDRTEFGLTGLPVLESEEMEAVQVESTWTLMIASAGVLLVLFVSFRSLKLAGYALASTAIALCWTLGWGTLALGHLNVLSVSFVVPVIGLGLAFSISWLTRYEVERSRGWETKEANLETVRAIAPEMIASGAMLALAFFSFMLTNHLGMREFGFLAGSGTILSLAATLTLLPALVAFAPSRSWGVGSNAEERPVLRAVRRWPTPVLCMAALLVVAAGFGGARLLIDDNLLQPQRVRSSGIAWEKRLFQETGTSGWHALTLANSAEEARRLTAEFAKLPSVGRVSELASMIPKDQPVKAPIIQRIHKLLAGFPNPKDLALAGPRTATIEPLLTALSKPPKLSSATDEIVALRLASAAERTLDALGPLPPAEKSKRLLKFQQLWSEDILLQLRRLRDVSQPAPINVHDLPKSLVSRLYSSTGKWAIQIFPKEETLTSGQWAKFRDELVGVDPLVTGPPIMALHSLEQMRRGFAISMGAGLVVIVVALWLFFRRGSLVLCALLPALVGTVSMLGLLGWLEIAIHPVIVVAMALVPAMGLHFGLAIVREYDDSPGPYSLRWSLGRSLFRTSWGTAGLFLPLLLSSHRGMVTLGWAIPLGMGTTLLASVLLLPAILAIFSRGRVDPFALEERSMVELPSTVYFREVA